MAPPAAAPPHVSPWRRGPWLRGAFIALLISLGVGFLMAVNDDPRYFRQSMAIAVAVGESIYLLARVFIGLLWRRLGRLSDSRRTAAITVIFALCGIAAWSLVMLVADRIWRLPFSHNPVPMAIAGGVAVIAGVSLHAYDRIRSRLAESIARLQAVEYAEKELLLARELQSRLLPPSESEGDGYRIAARNLPAQLVAGDFYDVFPASGGKLAVVVGDVAGKGMSAALIMASAKAMLPLVAAERTAAATLREANRRLAADLPGREFVALALALFEPATGALEIANAGLPDPYLLAAGQPPVALTVPGPRLPLAARAGVEYQSLCLRLAPGDRLLLISDGLPEAALAGGPAGKPAGGGGGLAGAAGTAGGGFGGGAAGEPLGYAGFARLLAEAAAFQPPLAAVDGLIERVQAVTQPVRGDDWTAVLLESVAVRNL